MGQPTCLEKQHHDLNFAMALGSQTTCQSPQVYTPVDPAGKLDELAGGQGPAKRSNAESN